MILMDLFQSQRYKNLPYLRKFWHMNSRSGCLNHVLFFFLVSWDLPNDQNFMYDSVILNFEEMVTTREHCLNLHEYRGIYVIMFNDSKSSILISRDSNPPSTSTYFFFSTF